MDGNKEVTIIYFALIIAFLISACNVQKPIYGGLYIDKHIDVDDTAKIKDSIIFNTDSVITDESFDGDESDLASSPNTNHSEREYINELNSLNQKESMKILQSISDSIHYLRFEIATLQKLIAKEIYPGSIHIHLPKMYFMDSIQSESPANQSSKNNVRKQITMDSAFQAKEMLNESSGKFDSLALLKQKLLVKTDSIQKLREQLKLQQKTVVKRDTVFITKDTLSDARLRENKVKLSKIESENISKNQEINRLRSEIQNQQKVINKTDTIFIVKNLPNRSKDMGSDKNVALLEQELVSKNETIKQLIDQLNFREQVSNKTDTIIITKKTSSTAGNFKADQVKIENDTLNNEKDGAEQIAQKDAVKAVKTKLASQQITTVETDSFNATIEPIDEWSDVQAENNSVTRKPKDLATNDTLIYNLNRIEPKFPAKKDSLVILKELPVVQTVILDTALFTATYDIGQIEPSNDILNEVIEVCQHRQVSNVILSGYTDSSGNRKVNKKITDDRLNYILSKFKEVISIDKIYLQNFGDTYASENVIQAERRMEIKVILHNY